MSIKDKRKAPIEKKIDKAMRKILTEDFLQEPAREAGPAMECRNPFALEGTGLDELEYDDDLDRSGYGDDFDEADYWEEDSESGYGEDGGIPETGYGEPGRNSETVYGEQDPGSGAGYGEPGRNSKTVYGEPDPGSGTGYGEPDRDSENGYGEPGRDSETGYGEPDGDSEKEYEESDGDSEEEYGESDGDSEEEYEESDSGSENEYGGEPQSKYGGNAGRTGVMGEKKHAKSARPGKIRYVPITEDDLETVKVIPYPKKKHKGWKVTGIAAAMLVVAAGCSYAAVSYYFSNRFFYGTTINGIDCSGKTAYEVEQLIAEEVENYSIQVLARNQEPETISASQIGYTYTSAGEVLGLLQSQKPYEWIRGFFETSSYTTQMSATYDKELLKTEVKALSCAQEENQVEPEDAYITLSGDEFTIVPETEGAELNIKEAYKALDSAISENQTTIDFDTESEVYVQASVTSTDETLQATRDAYNNYTKASITYTFGDQSVTLDSGTLKDWLEFDEKGELVSSDSALQQHITEYVAQLAASYDTVGTQRVFYTTSGRTVYVYGSAYGWKIDQAAEVEKLTEEIRSGTVTTREPEYSMTANSRGTNDLGNTYIEVDLSAQHMYYYQNGVIIMESDIVSGDMRYEDRKTPEGIYTLYYKKSPDTLKGKQLEDGTYEYETEVTYWMPFNGGIGFHDATWQPYFGGDRYLTGGSHGCINMPYDAAATLYSLIDYNVPIICFY